MPFPLLNSGICEEKQRKGPWLLSLALTSRLGPRILLAVISPLLGI